MDCDGHHYHCILIKLLEYAISAPARVENPKKDFKKGTDVVTNINLAKAALGSIGMSPIIFYCDEMILIVSSNAVSGELTSQ